MPCLEPTENHGLSAEDTFETPRERKTRASIPFPRSHFMPSELCFETCLMMMDVSCCFDDESASPPDRGWTDEHGTIRHDTPFPVFGGEEDDCEGEAARMVLFLHSLGWHTCYRLIVRNGFPALFEPSWLV